MSCRQLFLVLIFPLALFWQSMNTNAQEVDVWIGTSSNEGLFHCVLDAESGKLSPSKRVADLQRPGFIEFHPKQTHLYAVGTLEGVPSVVAYKVLSGGREPKLELVNSAEIGDGGAAHVSVDPTGKMLVTAQYGGGSTAAFQLNPDGSIGERTELIKHEGGSGVFENRQDAPHAHWTGFSPDNRFVFVPDLGLDQVLIYKADVAAGTLELHGSGVVPPGSGPRHMKFHPNGKWIYVLNELSLTVSAFEYDAKNGTMEIQQTIPTISQEEKDAEKFKSCSEIRIHPNGKFLYAANRGHDTITVMSIDEHGHLKVIQNENVRGATPRNFNLDPSARWLLAGGQTSNTLSSFEVNSSTGKITYNQSIINTPAPICILFGSK